jgi:hypothetical protein
MKKVILLVVLMPVTVFGQVIENFESGNLNNWIQSSENRWEADTLESISGEFSLHHIFDNPAGGSDCIGISLQDLHPAEGLTRWSFKIRHGYDPSSTNSWAAYLMSDTGPLSFSNGSGTNGFAVGVNLTGYDDTLRLWKVRNGSARAIIACPVNWQSDIGTAVPAEISVVRTLNGEWDVSVYDKNGILKESAGCTDNELFSCNWFILNYRYTSTRDRLLWMDDLEIDGVFRADNIPPEIIKVSVTGRRSLDITLNEEFSAGTLLPENISLNGGEDHPLAVHMVSSSKIRILFNYDFKNKIAAILKVNQLCDRAGNCSENITVGFTPVWAETGDIIISEIMADPLPSVSLPGKEYIELYNRTEFPVNLENWNLEVEGQKTAIPYISLLPQEYIIICAASDTALFKVYGKTYSLKSFPLLADAGRIIALTDSSGTLIHGIEYNSYWYRDVLKSGGGWSLEMIDTDFPFFTSGNWEASSSRNGGTPGIRNSASRHNPDISFYGMQNVFPEDSVTVCVKFSETVTELSGYLSEILINESSVVIISPSDVLYRQFTIRLAEPLERGKIYSILMPADLKDFAGNQIIRNAFSFGMTVPAGRNDIVFNELLFNPFPDEPDYIEFYNSSGKIVDASKLYLASINQDNGETSEVRPVSYEMRCIIPGTYYAITTDREKIIDRYFTSDPESVYNIGELPSMPDDKGHLLLLNREMGKVDEVIYNDDMHYPLLAVREGVSLEKIRTDLPSEESASWHSASEASGWGTPGKVNSVYSPLSEDDDRITLSSSRISPDNDGYEDVLVIDIDPTGLGNIISVTVFDEKGNYIRKLAENLFAAGKASVTWDGTASDETLVNSGIYIFLIELYNDKGKTKSWKKVCTVIRNR